MSESSFIDRIPNPGDYVAYYPHKDDVPERFGKVLEVRQWEGFRKGPGDGSLDWSVSPHEYPKMKPGLPVRVTALRALVAWQRDENNRYGQERQSIVDTKFLKVINVEAIPHVIDTRPRLVFDPSTNDAHLLSPSDEYWDSSKPYTPKPAIEAARAEDV